MRIYEKKDSLIKKNPNLTDGQKQEIISVLTRHPSSENMIDWNKNNSLTYEEFLNVLRPLYINDLDFKGLIEGEDYDLLLDKPNEKLYAIYTHNASKIIASNSVEPRIWTKIPSWCGEEEKLDKAHAFGHFDSEHGNMKPGAKWCISMQTSDKYWNQYEENFYFVFWIRDNESLGDNQKIAISIDKENKRIPTKYNASDNKVSLNIPQYIGDAISKNFNNFKEKRKEINKRNLLSKFTLNPSTNRYDCDESLNNDKLINFVSEDREGFTINFGKITGDFDCSGLGLTSLKGAPQEVGGSFNCSGNQLNSLEGAPQKVGGYFWCYVSQLTSLKGAPKTVDGSFYCYGNKLTSLEGAPTEVGGDFECSNNQFTSLKGAPQIVRRNFYCSSSKLTSLKGAPQTIGWDFRCSDNQLTSLEGAPQIVGRDFYCNDNKLISLEGAPKKVGRDFYCYHNPNLQSLEGIGEVKRNIYKK